MGVRDLSAALRFYTSTLALLPRGVYGREDFLGLFSARFPGWHHVEFRLMATDPDEALGDLEARNLLRLVRRIGRSYKDQDAVASRVSRGVEIFFPLIQTPLVAELADPEGRSIELVYLSEDY